MSVRLADVHHPGSMRKRTHDVGGRRRAGDERASRAAKRHEPQPVHPGRARLLGRLQHAGDMVAVQECIDELGGLRSADEYAVARAALLRAVVSKVEKQQPVDAQEYADADFGI